MRVPVLSPMYGSVALFLVDSGTPVSAGECIGQVEAMKVNYPIDAPTTGILTITTELGEIVGEGEEIGWVDETTEEMKT